MKKFTKAINESKKFLPDPSVLKMVAAHLLPLYLEGVEKYNPFFMEEYLESLKPKNIEKNRMNIFDLEIELLKLFVNNPLFEDDYKRIIEDIKNGFIRIDKLMEDKRKEYYNKLIKNGLI